MAGGADAVGLFEVVCFPYDDACGEIWTDRSRSTGKTFS